MSASLVLVAGIAAVVALNGYAGEALALAGLVAVTLAAAVLVEFVADGWADRRDAARRNQAWRVR